MVTLTAKYAAFARPAPNSFEILVLFKCKHVMRLVMVNNKQKRHVTVTLLMVNW